MKLAILQTKVRPTTAENLDSAAAMLKQVRGADLAVLPEMFSCPYAAANFPIYAQPAGGPVWQALSDMARENGLFLVGGSVPEEDGGKIYNTSYVFSPDGTEIARHRKVHLFDIDIRGGQRFRESDTLTAGDRVTVFDTPFGRLGLCICYDMRFPELWRLMALQGAQLVICPGAFNMTTGPKHWELTLRARAVDNQVFAVGCAPARDICGDYVSFANSLVASPWGDVRENLGVDEGFRVVELDLAEVAAVRQQLPLLQQRRTDLYELRER